MAGALRNAMVYLGLAEDDRYAEDGDTSTREEPAREARPETRREHVVETRHESRPYVETPSVVERRTETTAQVTPIRAPQGRADRKQVANVVPSSSGHELHRITTIHPRTYNEAKTIGESFREGIPVIMNLTDMSDGDAKRLVDFSAGLVFGLHGAIERVTNKVFLLSPQNVEVATQEEERPAERTFFNQS